MSNKNPLSLRARHSSERMKLASRKILTGIRLYRLNYFVTFTTFLAITIFLLNTLCGSALSTTNMPSQTQKQKLKQLDQQIQTAKLQLQASQQSADTLSEQLKKIEKDIGILSMHIISIENKIFTQNKQLLVLQKKENQLTTQLIIQRKALEIVLISAYQNRQETLIKILLNQEDPQKFSRMNNYYSYYSDARIKLIHKVQTTIAELNVTQNQIKAKITDLNTLYDKHVREQQNIKKLQQDRKNVLSQTKQQIKTQKQKLNQLIENKRRLENLVARLGQQEFLNNIQFNNLKGRLPWPIIGKITTQFGSKHSPQSLPEQGVFISAPAGQTVSAVASGKIIYADWLKGFGLLMIIDHGKGFMTLYAHCNSLLKNIGDTALTGDLIATAGNSGGLQDTGILFEIRKNGKPINPNRWCKGNPPTNLKRE